MPAKTTSARAHIPDEAIVIDIEAARGCLVVRKQDLLKRHGLLVDADYTIVAVAGHLWRTVLGNLDGVGSQALQRQRDEINLSVNGSKRWIMLLH